MINYFKNLLIILQNINVSLIQIYGELNRLRLIAGEKSERGKKIEEYDRMNFKYNPYFGSERRETDFGAMKEKNKNMNQDLEAKVTNG